MKINLISLNSANGNSLTIITSTDYDQLDILGMFSSMSVLQLTCSLAFINIKSYYT